MAETKKTTAEKNAADKTTAKKKTERYYKSRKDKMLDGVCAGLADYLGIDANLVRILWFLSIFINGVGIIAYVVAAIFVPVNPDHAGMEGGEKKKPSAALIVGAILILLGLLFLADAWDFDYHWRFPRQFRFFPLWSMDWGLVWPIVLIGLGIVYIVFVLRKDKEEGKEGTSKTAKAETGARQSRAEAGPRMERVREGKIVAGVCGGIAKHFKIDATLLRIGFVVVTILTHVVFGLLVYVVMAAIIPQEETVSAEG